MRVMRRTGVTFVVAVAVLASTLLIGAQDGASWQVPATSPSASTQGAAPAARGAQPPAQFPPRGTGVSPEEHASLQAAVDRLAARVAALKKQHRTGVLADRVADVEIYLDAVRRPLKYDERLWSGPAGRGGTALSHAEQTLATGTARADALRRGETPWMGESGVRGFYSRLDGSAQPYILTMPDGYDPGAKREYRLDIFMHGRDDTVLEQQFMAKSTTGYASKPFGAGPDRFMLQPYGRYTNASRIAGEVDGLEALASVGKAYPIDQNRIVMAGFSMGGASAWSYIVHHADKWAAGAPGAGFTETEVFLRGALRGQPQNAVQQTLWKLHDSTAYSANVFNLPVVAYSGEIDGQKQAADAMASAMQEEGLTLEHIIGPKTGHAYEAGARQQIQDRLDAIAAKGRNPVPREVRLTTWTLRYNRMFWLAIEAMGEHWVRARADAKIDGETIAVTTTNVDALRVEFAVGESPFAVGSRPRLVVDGTALTLPAVARDRSLRASVSKASGTWKVGVAAEALRKAPGLQGPIDDAFMEPFVFVRPTGTPLSQALGAWAEAQADYAASEWVHFFRGEPRVKHDRDVTAADIANSNLVLFGDPSSNAVYRRIAARLPITWTSAGVKVGDQIYPADHAPVFVFPNPLNPRRYVVINSGFTFHDQSNNAMQSPKLPDWAVVDITKPGNNYRYLPLHVVSQGFFDEAWQLKPPSRP